MTKDKKQNYYEFGLIAEEKVAEEYIKKGYTILDRRWKLGHTEIDIIAQRDNEIIIIEVKARSGNDEDALSAVTFDKRRRMVKAADSYLRRLKGEYNYRFDIVACTGSKEKFDIEIYEDAFLSTDLI